MPLAQEQKTESSASNSAGSRKYEWYLHSLKRVRTERPFALPFLGGLLLWRAAEALRPPFPDVSLALDLAGKCLMVYAAAHLLRTAAWIKRREGLTFTIWVAAAGTSVLLLFFAYQDYRTLWDPDHWLEVSNDVHPTATVNRWLHEGDYLIDLDPQAAVKFEKVGSDGIVPGPVRKLLDRQIEISRGQEALLDYILVTTISNKGPRTISARQVRALIGYEWTHQTDRDAGRELPPEKEIELPIGRLRPGQDFVFVAFSTNPDMYATAKLPENVLVRVGVEREAREIKLNYPGKFGSFVKHITTRGVAAHGGQ